MREIRSEFTANLIMQPAPKPAAWEKPSICRRPAVKVSVLTRVWRAIVGAL